MLVCGNGLDAYGLLGNYIVPMFVECDNLPKARQVLWRLIDRDEYSWTSLIKGYIDSGDFYYGLDLYKSMQEDLVDASGFTFVALLKACAQLRLFDVGLKFHIMIIGEEYEKDPFIGNSLIYMYAKCGLLSRAHEVFTKIRAPNVVAWTALIAGYVEHIGCLRQMCLKGVSPNAVTFECCVKACGDSRAMNEGREIHAEMARMRFLQNNHLVGSALVEMYVKWGALAKAHDVFCKIPIRNRLA